MGSHGELVPKYQQEPDTKYLMTDLVNQSFGQCGVPGKFQVR
jgi:hypothetical protein